MLGSSVYVVTGEIVRLKAGPAACLSYLFAGFAALLCALCYAELGSRFPKAGSAYTYTYVAIGELLAFVIGWSVVCEYVISVGLVAKGWSNTLDSLLHYTISNWTRVHLPFAHDVSDDVARYSPIRLPTRLPLPSAMESWSPLSANFSTTVTMVTADTTTFMANISNTTLPPGNGGWFADSPDLVAFGITMLLVALLCSGAKTSLLFNNVTNGVSLVLLAIVCVVMFIHAEPVNLTQPGGFTPYGVPGIIRGSALAFYSYIGFDAVAVAAEEVRDPSKTVPRASAYCIFTVTCIMLTSTLALVMFIVRFKSAMFRNIHNIYIYTYV
jgi:amino acid transporter